MMGIVLGLGVLIGIAFMLLLRLMTVDQQREVNELREEVGRLRDQTSRLEEELSHRRLGHAPIAAYENASGLILRALAEEEVQGLQRREAWINLSRIMRLARGGRYDKETPAMPWMTREEFDAAVEEFRSRLGFASSVIEKGGSVGEQ